MKDGEDEESGGEGFEAGGWSAANLAEDGTVDSDDEDNAEGSEGEELLKEFVVGVGCLEGAEGRDDEAIGVEAITEDGLFDCVFPGCGPDDGAAGERGGIDAFGVEIEVFCEQAGERAEDHDARCGDFYFGGATDGFVFEEIERHCDEKSDDGGLADASNQGECEPCGGPSPPGVVMGEIQSHESAENADHADEVGMKEDIVAETEVGHCGKAPGDDSDRGGAPDEALHNGGGPVLSGPVAQKEPDGGDVGGPGGPEAECSVERAGGPKQTDEVEAEESGDPSQGGSVKRRRRNGGCAADVE